MYGCFHAHTPEGLKLQGAKMSPSNAEEQMAMPYRTLS